MNYLDDCFLDERGTRLQFGDFVRLTQSITHLNQYATVVGLDTLDHAGRPSGEDLVWVVLSTTDGQCLNSAIMEIHPSRVRFLRRPSQLLRNGSVRPITPNPQINT